MKARRWNKFWANLNGYFWLPCPVCGKHFGGHEWGNSEYSGIRQAEDETRNTGICPDCEKRWARTGFLNI